MSQSPDNRKSLIQYGSYPSLPLPGYEKIVSNMKLPPINPGIDKPLSYSEEEAQILKQSMPKLPVFSLIPLRTLSLLILFQTSHIPTLYILIILQAKLRNSNRNTQCFDKSKNFLKPKYCRNKRVQTNIGSISNARRKYHNYQCKPK
jgi:hypothetical protein